MAAGETLLKFTDYPFAYSIVGIISGMLGFSLSQNSLIFLGLAGAIGTFFTIVDPLGEILRKNAERRIKKKNQKKELDSMELQFKLSSLKTKSITYELEKIIGIFYFLIVIILFLFAVILPTPFFEKLMIHDSNNVPLCSDWCFKLSYSVLSFFALLIIFEKVRRFWRELNKKINIAADHMSIINDDNATQTSVASMTRAVEQNDWELAELWSHKIDDEIINKKGKRELIIKSADLVFSPLHFESSDFQKYLENLNQTKQYADFETKKWDEIKQKSLQSLVEDIELRQRIENFYKLMNDYNDLTRQIFPEINQIINKNFSNVFGKDVNGVELHMDHPNSGNTVYLYQHAMFETNPLESKSSRKFGSFKLQIIEENKRNYLEFTNQESFDDAWRRVLEDVKNNEIMIKTKRYLKELETENLKLIKIYSEHIEMQWNV